MGVSRISGGSVDIGAYEYVVANALPAEAITIQVFAGTGGTVTGTGFYEEGQMVEISATSSDGYIFSDWGGDAGGLINPFSIMVDVSKYVIANIITDLNDYDEDGLSNYQELVIHMTSESNFDADGDGLTDKQEIDRGLNPRFSDKAVIDAFTEIKDLDGNASPYSEC